MKLILIQRIKNNYIQLTLFIILIIGLTACEKEITTLHSAYWKDSSVISAPQGSAVIVISGVTGVNWSAEIIEGDEWCSFSSSHSQLANITGFITSEENLLYIYCTTNVSATDRKAKISFKFEGEDAQTFILTQTTFFATYVETPSYKEDENYRYVTHYTSLKNQTVRNFSLCFDASKRAALWIAYPLHVCYTQKGTGRTDEWGFDPVIDFSLQANCVTRSYGGYYDRGHQIASADRLASRHMNVQTFFMSNLTPQLNRLNQDMWANLEIKVRSFICSDTLYVVTGAYFDESTELKTTYDGAGNLVPLPTHYFKVLLRTVSGSTGKTIAECSADELQTIGFWVEHRSYGDIPAPSSTFKSVADIEAYTGFKFFPQVADNVKKQMNPSQWGL